MMWISRVSCVFTGTSAHQNCMQQCMYMPDFEILLVVNVQAHTCTQTEWYHQ